MSEKVLGAVLARLQLLKFIIFCTACPAFSTRVAWMMHDIGIKKPSDPA